MKVVVNSYDLAEAINKVSKAVATKGTNGKVLEGIKLTAKNDKLTLLAFDSEISIETTIKCDSFVEGETVINGKLLSEYANKLENNEEVEIELQANGQAKIICGKLKFMLSTMNEKDFPVISIDDIGNEFEISVTDLKTLVNRVAFCCATDEARPILKGVLLEEQANHSLIACALDGFRLAKEMVSISGATKEGINCIVPARSLNELIKLIDKDIKHITVNISKHRVCVITGDTIFTTRLFAGAFVNYKQLLANSYETEVFANREELISVLDRASILAKNAQNLIKVELKDSILTISADTDIGKMDEDIEVRQNGKNIRLYLNYKFLLDCLKVVDSEEISLQFKDSQNPMYIRGRNTNWEYLILPIRVNK